MMKAHNLFASLLAAQHLKFIFFAGLVIFFILLWVWQRKSIRIKQWQRSLNLKQHGRAFQDLYQDVDGFYLSRQDREQRDALELIYGEVLFLPYIALMSLTKPAKDTIFYDLGCGTGKAVLAYAMVYPARKYVGVEILPKLYNAATKQTDHLAKIIHYKAKATKIRFILGDFLEINLDDATLIYINSSTIFGQTWENLCLRLDKLPQLKTIVTTSKPLISSVFAPIISTKIQMGWGIVSAYIHTRKQILTNPLENIE